MTRSSPRSASDFDVLVLGAGAAGLMCAIESARRGRLTLVLDHSDVPAEKIRISGGGRCNFTNVHSKPSHFLSDNPQFCQSALRRFTPQNFVERVKSHHIPFHEKALGQLFCDDSAHDIIDMLLNDLQTAGGGLQLNTKILNIKALETGFEVETSSGPMTAQSVVVATGGLSIPKIGATGFAYEIATQFGHDIIPTRAGLVPFTFGPDALEPLKALSGVSLPVQTKFGKGKFDEAMLFTHRGLSGPAILQISSYWQPGQPVVIDLVPSLDLMAFLKELRKARPRIEPQTMLKELLPHRLADQIHQELGMTGRLADQSDKVFQRVVDRLKTWGIVPAGTEGYRTAEVTLGGINTREISSKNMESLKQKGLYFIGEALDVTGHLGGHNFQWAWASGWAAGQTA